MPGRTLLPVINKRLQERNESRRMSSFPTLRAALRSPTKIAISARGCKYGECRFGLLQIVFVADIPEILVSLYTHLCSQNIPVIIAARRV